MNNDLLVRAEALRARGIPCVMATVVRAEAPTSGKPGDKAIVDADGEIDGWIGGGCAQPAVAKSARQVLADGQPRLIRITPNREEVVEAGVTGFSMSCHSGGTLDIFLEPILPARELLIVGASPVARALCKLADATGFTVTVAAPKADPSDFPGARRVWEAWPEDPAAVGGATWTVVATQGKQDEQGLRFALDGRASRIAFVASARKSAKLQAALLEAGASPERVDAIIAPAGLQIGARTPEEIALAILAQIVSDYRQGDLQPVARAPAEDTAEPALEEAPSCCGGGESAR